MRILFVLENYYPLKGGSETLFRSLAEQIAANGHEVLVLTRKRRGLKSTETLNGVKIRRIWSPDRLTFGILGVLRGIKNARSADIIHTTLYSGAFAASVLGNVFRKPVILTVHEVWSKFWFDLPHLGWIKKNLFYFLERFTLKMKFTSYIGVSSHTTNDLRTLLPLTSSISTIYNGLDYEIYDQHKETPKNNSRFEFLFFGRLGVSKGLDIFLDAIEIFENNQVKRNQVHYNIVIPFEPLNPLFQRLQSLKKLNDYGKRFTLYHDLSQEHLIELKLRSDCAVIPSRSEGFGYAAAECSALGIPLIHSGKGALKETATGKCIEMKRLDPESLTIAMNNALEGRFLKVPQKRFPIQKTIEGYLDLYKSLA